MQDEFKSLIDLYNAKKECTACSLRKGCTQVVPGSGKMDHPILMIIAESPGESEDEEGEPLIGRAGQTLREVLRATKIINRTNTLLTNVLGCRPPHNKFPTDESASICVGKWLSREITIASPKRLLLLGNVPLKYVAGLAGITTHRGKWIEAMNVRSMPTYHPSYVLRQDGHGDMQTRTLWERDIEEMAKEVKQIQEEQSDSAKV